MKLLLLLPLVSLLVQAQSDPADAAYKAWSSEHRGDDFRSRAQSLLEASAEWVAKWPDSKDAWRWRRESLVETRSNSAEIWKQVDENLIRLRPPHSFAAAAASDWIGAKVNLEDAERLISSEIEWVETRIPDNQPPKGTLVEQIEQAQSVLRLFNMLGTEAAAQIQLKQFDRAHGTVSRMLGLWEGNFRNHYDQDPVQTFPDYESRYFSLAAELAEAEGKILDALATYQHIITNPYFRRMYPGPVEHTHVLWKQAGGGEDAWALFSKVPALPAGVPGEAIGTPFFPWEIVNYKLPDFKASGLNSSTWTPRDFEGKITLMYLWASWCAPCWAHLPVVQGVYDAIRGQPGVQIVTLSEDEDPEKLAAFMKQKGYTFPVVVSKSYREQLFPQMPLGQEWIVDKSATMRRHRMSVAIAGRERAYVEEAVYKLGELANDSLK